jgi:hypothetical protein
LFEIARTDKSERFSNPYYSEIDVIGSPVAEIAESPGDEDGIASYKTSDGKYDFTIDTSDTPALREWATKELAPVVQDWYPKIVEMLPSDGFEPPQSFSITFSSDDRGVASTSGARIRGGEAWFLRSLQGEAKGAMVHELVHVAQQYGRARRTNRNATRPPGWLVEGIPDYIRWFLYEPETKGAEITRRNLDRARYDASYRVTGNFLNWVTTAQDRDIVVKLNAAAREGRYEEGLWKEYTGKTLEDLGREWKEGHEKRLAPDP